MYRCWSGGGVLRDGHGLLYAREGHLRPTHRQKPHHRNMGKFYICMTCVCLDNMLPAERELSNLTSAIFLQQNIYFLMNQHLCYNYIILVESVFLQNVKCCTVFLHLAAQTPNKCTPHFFIKTLWKGQASRHYSGLLNLHNLLALHFSSGIDICICEQILTF